MVPGLVGVKFLLWNAGSHGFQKPKSTEIMPMLHQKNEILACFALIMLWQEKCWCVHTLCMEFVLWFCNSFHNYLKVLYLMLWFCDSFHNYLKVLFLPWLLPPFLLLQIRQTA